jgi:hypothetical protein
MDVRTEDVNYVILQDNGKPLVWAIDGMPVIYGGIEDAELDLNTEDGERIITLGEYAKSIGLDWRLLVDNEFVSAKDKLHIILSDKEDRCYIFEDELELPQEIKGNILSVYENDDFNLEFGFDIGGFLFTQNVTDYMAEYIMTEIMKQIYPR